MKKAILLLTILLSVGAMAQSPKDTTAQNPIPASAEKYIYIFDYTDTVQVNCLLIGNENGTVSYKHKCSVVFKGQAVMKDKKPQWIREPKAVEWLDEKKKPVKNVIATF